jgi:predicted extracellular nuclease
LADLTRASDPVELWVIANHFKSKTEDTDLVAYTLPRRVEQAAFVADRLRQIRSAHPAATLLVMGDLNDLSGSAPLLELNQADLLDLITRLARADRYTYIYQGIAQELDHILLSAGPGLAPLSIQPVHINADYPVYLLGDSTTSLRSSDHDPLWLRLGVFEFSTYLPIMMH